MLIKILIILLFATAWLLNLTDFELWAKAAANLAEFIKELRIDVEAMHNSAYALIDTLLLSLFATSAAFVFSLILSIAASPLFSPKPIALSARLLANFMRSVPALLWGVIAVIMFGPGIIAGVVALTIYATGYLTKLFYETLENVDRGLVEALRAMGLSGLIIALAVIRHMRRQLITNTLFILEYNVRTATILGIVGAGGIGYYIVQYMTLLNYSAVFSIVVMILAVVGLIDLLSYLLRRALT